MKQPWLKLSNEVREALKEGTPVVALESTIISHGMPYPKNIETARLLEETVREHGAIPATIAVIGGKVSVGLSESELHTLATSDQVSKVSRQDLGRVLAQKSLGATTVSATMIASSLAGIRVFATGGIGGVHRGASETFDVSCDLTEFTKSDVCVISAGVKSILDIPKTLETLETLGVPVAVFQSDEFPAFYHGKSGVLNLPRVDDLRLFAEEMSIRWHMGLKGGGLLAVPVDPQHGLDPVETEAAIRDALELCEQKGMVGKEITPFLLQNLFERTAGATLATNIALVQQNARVAAQLANAFASLGRT